jgi:hypothetical protein
LGIDNIMSQLLNQDSRNTNPVRRPVGGHFTGIPDDPRKYSVVPTNMELPPNSEDVDPRTGHPKSAKIHMQELKVDPMQPGIDRVITNFGPNDNYHNYMGTAEVTHRTNVPLTDTPHRAGSHYITSARYVGGLSSLRAMSNSFIPTAGVRKPIYGI